MEQGVLVLGQRVCCRVPAASSSSPEHQQGLQLNMGLLLTAEEKTAGCFTAKLFLALDVTHEVTPPLHTELGTRPRASRPAAGFTRSQVRVC